MVIPANAQNPEGANAFLNYLMRPEVAATIQPWTMYLNVNAAAADLLPEGSLDYAALNIPEDLFATSSSPRIWAITRASTRISGLNSALLIIVFHSLKLSRTNIFPVRR